MATEERNYAETHEIAVAGLFEDDKQATEGIDRVKAAGIEQKQIGVASADGEAKQRKAFWKSAKESLGSRDEETRTTNQFQQVLMDDGIPGDKARYFTSRLHSGCVLVTVHTDPAREVEIRNILLQSGADVGGGAAEPVIPVEQREARPMPELAPAARTDVPASESERRIQLLGERLRIRKQKVDRGEVTLRKETVTEPQRIEVPVTHEEVVIERHSAAGKAPEGEIGKQQNIRIPVSEEKVEVEKRPEVREEVTARTKPVEEMKEVADSTRREELRVEKKGAEVEELTPEQKRRPEIDKLSPEERKRVA